MKLLSSLLILFSTVLFSPAQVKDPVKWSAAYSVINEKEGEIKITAVLDNNWHTYSQKPTDDGPVPTSFLFETDSKYTLLGDAQEFNVHEEFVPAFDAKLFLFSGKAEFVQKVKLNAKPGFAIKFKVEYMCCDNTMCLPPKTIDLMVVTKS